MENKNSENIQMLFLGAGPFSLERRMENDKFFWFNKYFSVDFVTPVNRPTKNQTGLKVTKLENRVRLHPYPCHEKSSVIRVIKHSLHAIIKSLKIYYIEGRKYRIIVSPNPLNTAVVALIISRLTGAKVIIEVNGNFESAFKYGRLGEENPGIGEKIKDKISKYLIRFTLTRGDMTKLVSRSQIDALVNRKAQSKLKIRSFPNFTPITYFLEEEKMDEKYILLLGYPWYLKGVDVLIKAFKMISDEFPEHRLKIVGWCVEGRGHFESLAGENMKIELCDAVAYNDVIPLMTRCSVYILASRTDASPRVLREAMASEKPIIASRIDGVPDLIKNEFNGLFFEPEDENDLAKQIRRVLSDGELALRLAKNGYEYVQERFSEECYIDNYREMIAAANN